MIFQMLGIVFGLSFQILDRLWDLFGRNADKIATYVDDNITKGIEYIDSVFGIPEIRRD